MKDEVEAHGCLAALQKYDHYSVKVKQNVHHMSQKQKTKFEGLNTRCWHHLFVWQEYLKQEGGLSPEAVRMIGDLLNEQSLMHLALTEMIYIQSDVSDSTT